MATFIKVNLVDSNRAWLVNMDLVKWIQPVDGYTLLRYPSGDFTNIKETPEEIMALLQPPEAEPVELPYENEEFCHLCVNQSGDESNTAYCMDCKANEYAYFRKRKV